LTRRAALATCGAWALACVPALAPRGAAAAAPSCNATPPQTDGPYFYDLRLNRADVRTDTTTGAASDGAPLALALVVHAAEAGRCAPLPGAVVDIWHCDAAGVYSHVPGTPAAERTFLRGYQIADGEGRVRFVTIYPGWYPGRSVHIHVKIRGEAAGGRRFAFSTQLYFDDALSDRVFALAPYARRGPRNVRNADDFLFRQGGERLLLAPAPGPGGYAAAFDVVLAAIG
jgi:protocatechuate 3,4-dioxygenase beta subunit